MRAALAAQILPKQGEGPQARQRIADLSLDTIFPDGGASLIAGDSDLAVLPGWNRELLDLISSRGLDQPVDLTVCVNAQTDFPENVARVRRIMEQADYQIVRLVFNQWEFIIDRTTPLEDINRSFITNMVGSGAPLQKIFGTDSLLSSNDADHVNFVGRVIAYANLVQESIIITGPTLTNLYIEPGDTLRNGVSGLKTEPHRTIEQKTHEPREESPKRHYDIEITDFTRPIIGTEFGIVLRTTLSKEDLHTKLCNEFYPISEEWIVETEGGFKVQYPEMDTDTAYRFIGTIGLAQQIGKEDPLGFAKELWKEDKKLFEELRLARMREKISHYYKLIDRGDLDRVLAMFAKDAVYIRCEDTFNGIQALEQFYRLLREGVIIRHIVKPEDITVAGNTVFVSAHFTSSKFEDGLPRTFQDFWTFDDEGLLVTKRVSTLGLGGSAVKK